MRRRSQGERMEAAAGSGLPMTLALLAAAVSVSAVVAAFVFLGHGENSPPGPKTAAIVDQLSLTQPNPAFIGSATNTLREAGYFVDYIPGEQVTVELYRSLPARDYDLVILRVHSGRIVENGNKTDDVILFTGEPFDNSKYQPDRLAGHVGWARYHKDASPLFGIMPAFIEVSAVGKFDNTLVVMMGCDGLRSQRMAEAFLDKGAKAFVSWSRPVSAAHTDAATERLLEHLLEDVTIADAVIQTAAEVGPDPFFQAELRLLDR